MAVKNFMRRLGAVAAAIALTMSAAALSNPASAATTTSTLQNYHTGLYVTDNGYGYWTHSTDLSSTVIQNTGTGRCLYNPGGDGVAIGPCAPANHAYWWQVSAHLLVNGITSYQFKNYHTGTCLYGNAAGTPYLDTCSSNHADYWH